MIGLDYSALIDWGDGMNLEPVTLPAMGYSAGRAHTYDDNGEYLVSLEVMSNVGTLNAASFHVTVRNLSWYRYSLFYF